MVRTVIVFVALGATVAAAGTATQGRPRRTPRTTAAQPAAASAPAQAFVVPPAPAAPAKEPSRFGVEGLKIASPQTRMTQAGVKWSLSNHVSLHLSYERTAYAPLMLRDHDDGILTGLRLGF